jgi:IstB-like ATP binding protein
MSTATKARIDTAYQRLREHLAYLGLATASEELAPALERARTLKLPAVEVLEDLMAKEAEATRTRRLAGRLRFAHYPLRKTLADFEFDYQPSIDRKTLGELSALALCRGTPQRPAAWTTRGRQDAPGDRAWNRRHRGRLPHLLHHRRRPGHRAAGRAPGGQRHRQDADLHRPVGAGGRRARLPADGPDLGPLGLPGRIPALGARLDRADPQPRVLRLGSGLRRPGRRRRHLGPAPAPRHRPQHAPAHPSSSAMYDEL